MDVNQKVADGERVSASSRIKFILGKVLPPVLGLGLLWLLYRNMDWVEVSVMLRSGVDFGILLAGLSFALLALVLRGLRWHLLLLPISKGEPRPRVINAIYTIMGSYTINMGIPRAGELWRCAEYGRRESLPFSTLLGTLINDRLMDVLSLMLILLGVVLAYWQFFLGFLGGSEYLLGRILPLVSNLWLYVALCLLGLFGFVAVRYCLHHPESRISQMVLNVGRGIWSIRHLEHKGRFVLYSFLIWLCYFLGFYTSFFAFSATKDLSIEVALIAFAMSSLSVIAPVPAGMGPWHYVVILTLTTYGVAEGDAKSFALIVHTIQTLWITLVGLVAIVALPFVNRGYSRLSRLGEDNPSERME